ncbi:MAG: ABC-2 transporter permease [bacterium]|nr:ABC-2 transporter permease [bacterium]
MLTLIKNYYIANRGVFGWTALPMTFVIALVFLVERKVGLPMFCFAFIAISTQMQTEEKSRTETLYCSLPLKRSSIVYSRYLSVLAVFTVILLFTLLVCFSLDGLDIPGRDVSSPVITFTGIFNVIIPLTVITAAIFPFYYRYGYGKALAYGSLTSVLLGAGFTGILYAVIAAGGKTVMVNSIVEGKTGIYALIVFVSGIFAQAIDLMGKQNFQVFTGIFAMILLWVSVMVSVRFYKNREF